MAKGVDFHIKPLKFKAHVPFVCNYVDAVSSLGDSVSSSVKW